MDRQESRTGQRRDQLPRRTNSHSTATMTMNHNRGCTVSPSAAAITTMTRAITISISMTSLCPMRTLLNQARTVRRISWL